MELKRILKENHFTYSIIKCFRKIQNFCEHTFIFCINKTLRNLGISKNKHIQKIKEYKDLHANERCFIVATGPSLTISDLHKIKDEITFSMNSIVLGKENYSFTPTYYGIQDLYVYDKIKNNIFQSNYRHIFIADRIAKKRNIPANSVVFPLNLLNHNYLHKKYNTKFSDDCYEQVYDGYTITYSLIQIAVYMGIKEIYLIGADTNYIKDNRHFIDHGVNDPTYKQAGIRMIEAYKVAKEYADNHRIKIYNATRGGMLEVFQRVDLDEVLRLKGNKNAR